MALPQSSFFSFPNNTFRKWTTCGSCTVRSSWNIASRLHCVTQQGSVRSRVSVHSESLSFRENCQKMLIKAILPGPFESPMNLQIGMVPQQSRGISEEQFPSLMQTSHSLSSEECDVLEMIMWKFWYMTQRIPNNPFHFCSESTDTLFLPVPFK